jgi:hypothetical protein
VSTRFGNVFDVTPSGGWVPGAVILGDKILNTNEDIRRKLSETTLAAINAFHKKCEALCTADEYYDDYWRAENLHPWANKTFAELLNGIPDEIARRYVATAAHTDVAATPHLTSALNGIKNVLMDNEHYLKRAASKEATNAWLSAC